MSRENSKKKQKNFYAYQKMLDELKVSAEELRAKETIIIEAALNFFLECPKPLRQEIFLHYLRSLPGDNIEKLLDTLEKMRDPKKTLMQSLE